MMKDFDDISSAPDAGSKTEAALAFGMVGILMLMILPLPSFIMDMLLAANISFSLMLLCVALFLQRPLEFSVFPTMLLLATLSRLGLNVATTRLILLHGHEGTGAAGHVIETFGHFVVGGNFVVGAIVFFILVIINFVVITKGAGRVAEVAARFTLDAMPGKQMAIDAELASGSISEDEAKARRREIEREADFHGAMDGSSKFVRGDAVAGLIITGINIIGGLIVGVTQQSMALGDAAKTYTLLTIGDGLVSQIPALMVSTAAGVVITRAASGNHLGQEIKTQLLRHRRSLQVVALLLFGMGWIPGMPSWILFLLAASSYALSRRETRAEATGQQPPQPEIEETPEMLRGMLPLDTLEMELGYGLVRLVKDQAEGSLLGRIKAIRRQFAFDLGFIVPPVHIRDNLNIEPEIYRVLIRGVEIGRGKLMPDRLLAMNPGQVSEEIQGIPGREPAFGMDALWIQKNERERAEAAGYTVVDCATVVATHLTEIIRSNSADLLGRQETQELIDVAAKSSPRLVEDLIPGVMSLGEVTRVLKLLLSEEVSLRDMTTIIEVLSDEAQATKDPLMLAEAIRIRLGRAICQKVADPQGRLHAILLDQSSESMLRSHLVRSERGPLIAMGLQEARTLVTRLQSLAAQSVNAPLLIVAADLRRPLHDLLRPFVPQLTVLSHREVVPRSEIRTIGTLSLPPADMDTGLPRSPLEAGAGLPFGDGPSSAAVPLS